MSFPRQIVPGRVYMVTRRCTQRTFLLRPDRETNEAFIYCLGFAAQEAGVDIIAFVAMSNHWHGIVVDRLGRLPEFLERFHKLLAKHQNALRGRWENFWSSEQTSLVQLVNPEDILRKLVYTLANPVAEHLVAHARHWPGATSLKATMRGGFVEASRPKRFFRSDGRCPDRVRIRMHRPPGFEELTDRQFAECVLTHIRQKEQAARAERARTGRSVIGRAAILRQSWQDRPGDREVRRGMKPQVACQNSWSRIEALARNKLFIEAYRAARDLWRKGIEVVFPFGTYWLRRFAGAATESELTS